MKLTELCTIYLGCKRPKGSDTPYSLRQHSEPVHIMQAYLSRAITLNRTQTDSRRDRADEGIQENVWRWWHKITWVLSQRGWWDSSQLRHLSSVSDSNCQQDDSGLDGERCFGWGSKWIGCSIRQDDAEILDPDSVSPRIIELVDTHLSQPTGEIRRWVPEVVSAENAWLESTFAKISLLLFCSHDYHKILFFDPI